MEKIQLSLEVTLFAKEHGAKWYNPESRCIYTEHNDKLYFVCWDGDTFESVNKLRGIYFYEKFKEIDFSIIDEQPKQEPDYKQLALQMAESVYNLSRTLDSLTPEEGAELQKALEVALIVLKEGE